MKILGLDDKNKFIVHMDANEFNVLTNRKYINHLARELVGCEFDISEQWRNIKQTELLIEHRKVIQRSYEKALDIISNLKLERLKEK